MWDKIQAVFQFLVHLPNLPKAIVSFLLLGSVAFLLVLMWSPTPAKPEPEPAVSDILAGCYRRAMFTRMHAQLSTTAMVASIHACLVTIQTNIPKIKNEDLKALAVKLLSITDRILHTDADNAQNWPEINELKLSAVQIFKQLAAATGGSYRLPDDGKLAEGFYFSNDEAGQRLTSGEIDAGNKNPMPLTKR